MTGKMTIFSAPSGAGKTTIVKHLLSELSNLSFSISATSRPKREGEIHQKDYYFLTVDDFKNKLENNHFVEWEEVYENRFYGTLKSEVERIWDSEKHVIFDVDVQGGINIKKMYKEKALAIFVQPPSIEDLKKRLSDRSTDSEEDIKIRVAKAEYEMTFANQFDYILVNDDLEKAKEEAIELVQKFLNN
jgi:guanylate kinase